IVLDIDHFKQVNDRFGHAAGDGVLRSVADVCRKQLRLSDLLARIGGEEFCVICPETDAARAGGVAERMRAAIAADAVAARVKRIPVTASFGVAGISMDHANFEQLIASADEMLYRSKESGRNQVWVVDESRRTTRLGPEPAIVTPR